jgi:hypothetical protein
MMDFTEALDKAGSEFKEQMHRMRSIKRIESRVDAVKMTFMRARDIDRENNVNSTQEFVFNISTMKEDGTWDRCPKCGDPDINKISANNVPYQGCFSCHILLGKFQIKSMKSQKKKEKPSDDTPNDNPQS